MNRRFWLQLISISLFFTVIITVIGLEFFRWLSVPATIDSRKNIYLFLAHIMESSTYPEAMQKIEQYRVESPSLASNIWVISANGQIITANTPATLPPEWQTIEKPEQIHAMSSKIKPFHIFADMTLIRLAGTEANYLLVMPTNLTPSKTITRLEILLFIAGLFCANCGGLAITFIYLRKTSREAKEVIARLHAGDLKARFEIKKIDEIGNLKLDFNAMADEIEKLLKQLRQIEHARTNLLHELGHDLRTPLTSLRTSFETLAMFRDQMNASQQEEFFSVIQSELNYFVRLLEDLFFIANIAEPGYKTVADRIDINALLQTEIQARQLAQPHLQWQFERKGLATSDMEGDAHLLSRLLRNTLDNASKFASTKIDVVLKMSAENIEIIIADDGAGMNSEAVQHFGKRRQYRMRQQNASQLDVSLGLGSVIIKTIVELHNGSLRIESGAINPMLESGTRFYFLFPRAHLKQ